MERPDVLSGITHRIRLACISSTGGGRKLYATVNQHDGTPVEVILRAGGEAGTCTAALWEALGRVISIALQAGVPADEITRTMAGIKCPSPVIGRHKSCVDALAKELK